MSNDLPFGTLASPGAGMLPTLLIGLMVASGLVLFVGAKQGPYLDRAMWTDLPHAARVVGVAAAAVALYTTLGFLITVGALLFVLIFLVERRPFLPAAAFSIGVTLLAFALFRLALRVPLPRGLIQF
jgi:putative tricarboxylic transport membrane protein